MANMASKGSTDRFVRHGGHAPIDLAQLATNTLGNRELQQEVLKLFLARSKTLISELSAADDRQHQADLVHSLKGSARGIGALRLADVCDTVEEELREGSSPAFLTLVSLVGETNDFIRELIEG
ncbi:histidine kinase [Pannonibacter phragmitetus]|uniref:Histidine kinase n=3 Tax=Pannonibacter TaxID=227873 RepID=A0A0L0J0R1_9HYPH|nr:MULTISPECIES: Hpt domain-containing protein [Pannonibacter]ALV28190.1 histidine kinase [Pannonibacter phragmitetus]KND19173.1 histidine kinase [Pannonibacter phragmitetus]